MAEHALHRPRHRSISAVGYPLTGRAHAGMPALPGGPGVTRPAGAPSRIQLIAYNEHSVIEEPNLSADELQLRFADNQPERVGRLTWVNLTSPHDTGALEAAAVAFGLHPLALEDASNLHLQQRPKAEGYERHLFVVLNIPIIHTATGDVDIHQVALFFGRDFIVTVQEGDRVTDACDATVWETVRERIRKGTGRIRTKGADWLAYALLDAAVDHYFPVLEIVDTRVERLEDEVLDAPDRKTVSRIHTIRRELLVVRRAAWPTREAIAALMRDYSDRFSEETRLFLRDIYDHVVQVIELEETDREVVAGLMDIYLSNINQRMNEVMKVLTIIATVFMPLSFIVGVYGMNFDHMPELHWQYGYPAIMVLMLLIAGGMVRYFHRQGWLSDSMRVLSESNARRHRQKDGPHHGHPFGEIGFAPPAAPAPGAGVGPERRTTSTTPVAPAVPPTRQA